MARVIFEVDTYTVLTTQDGPTSSGAWRMITLTSTALAHGIRHHASIYFFEDPGKALGVATNVDQPNYNGLTAYVFCWKADFAEWYDMLRNERPLKFAYFYGGPDFDPNQPVRNLAWAQLYTGMEEPPGEGPEQVQAHLFPAAVLDVLQAGARKVKKT